MGRTRMFLSHENLTFSEACEMYLSDCKQRNLREGTIRHYRQSYNRFYDFFDRDMPISNLDRESYESFVLWLKEILDNDVSINSYLRDLITTIHFLNREGYLAPFKMQAIKVDKKPVSTYTDAELNKLLTKPNIKKCSFTEYQCWVISCLLLSTGIRQKSLLELQVSDVDFENMILNVRFTKTRKVLLIPLNPNMCTILNEYVRYRKPHNKDDWLFCNVYGDKLVKSTSYHMLYEYNKRRGVDTTGLHRYRHTFAKQWILNGGNVVTLSKLLGHSSLNTTQNYINLLVSDIGEQVAEIDILSRYGKKNYIKMQ